MSEELTLEEQLYELPQDEIDGLKERLATLSRNVRSQGQDTYRFMQYEMSEDFESGNLGIDIVHEENNKIYRKAFLMIDRHGHLMVRAKMRSLVKQLSQALILEELEAI